MYILISPFFKSFNDTGLTYHVPSFLKGNIKKGIIVEIPFKDKIEYGIILNILGAEDITDLNESKIKSIINIHNENRFLSKYRKTLLKWIAKYYFTPIHNSNSLFFPKNLVDKIKKNKIDLTNTRDLQYNFDHKITFSEDQDKAYKKIKKSKNNKILFHGITGSGKTEIYIKLIKDNLEQQKQSLLMIPEIILTNQIAEKIKNTFGNDVIIINSTVTNATKTKYWLDINANKAKIVIGTRSALFYPYNNLGLIIIDEEHDNSYISDQAPRYNTIEVAEKITELNCNRLILASGTPRVESMYKALKKEFDLVSLLKKYS